jgi:hypothetical protein
MPGGRKSKIDEGSGGSSSYYRWVISSRGEAVFDHKQTKVFYPGYQELIEVDVGIAPLLLTLWDAGIMTCNSCEENEPGIMWIEFYSMKDVEKFLMIQIRTLGNRIHKYPEANDWFCYRILGQGGDQLSPWRFDAHPNVSPARPNQRSLYSKNTSECSVELSVSVRFPKEDYQIVLDLISNYLMRGNDNFEELSDEEWNYVKHYLPPQPLRGRKRSDDRRALNGILYVLKTGCNWCELPRRYGSYETAHRRLKQWSTEGVLDPILSNTKGGQACKERLSQYLTDIDDHHMAPQSRRAKYMTSMKGEMAPMSVSR